MDSGCVYPCHAGLSPEFPTLATSLSAASLEERRTVCSLPYMFTESSAPKTADMTIEGRHSAPQ